jgi:hypothetical protein
MQRPNCHHRYSCSKPLQNEMGSTSTTKYCALAGQNTNWIQINCSLELYWDLVSHWMQHFLARHISHKGQYCCERKWFVSMHTHKNNRVKLIIALWLCLSAVLYYKQIERYKTSKQCIEFFCWSQRWSLIKENKKFIYSSQSWPKPGEDCDS